MKTTLSLTTLALAAVLASTALAEENAKTTELTVDRYEKAFTVERPRTDLKRNAVFSAESQSIDENAILVFEIRSVSAEHETVRWRCVAEIDVDECLGNRVVLPYLKNDIKMVLSVTAKPKHTPEAYALRNGIKTIADRVSF
jgi:hypothetical protein